MNIQCSVLKIKKKNVKSTTCQLICEDMKVWWSIILCRPTSTTILHQTVTEGHILFHVPCQSFSYTVTLLHILLIPFSLPGLEDPTKMKFFAMIFWQVLTSNKDMSSGETLSMWFLVNYLCCIDFSELART